MTTGPTERYTPRGVTYLGLWEHGSLRVKAYGLEAKGQTVTVPWIVKAQHILIPEVLPKRDAMGDSNDMGFVILHPGSLGVSVTCHWWVQGSVLCQHVVRQLYGADTPMNTEARPVIGCVWELEIVAAEQAAWRQHMMSEAPNPAGYLNAIFS